MCSTIYRSSIRSFAINKGQKIVEERIQYLIDQLQEEMNEVQEYLIDRSLLDTEAGFDLVNKTFAATAKTRQREKIKIFA